MSKDLLDQLRYVSQSANGYTELADACIAEIERLQRAIGKLSAAMGSPAVNWNSETGSIEQAVVDEAIRRLPQIRN